MKQISIETKEAIVKQALQKKDKNLSEIAAANNIGYSTLQKWLRAVREGRPLGRSYADGKTNSISKPDQFRHLLATANLDESALGGYCRQHGLYSHQLTTWKESFMSNSNQAKHAKQLEELKKVKTENKTLKKDLRRKEKALAEASALLVLKKKADLIWGENEDD